jgi:hypothetical protein
MTALLRGSDADQTRTLSRIGAGVAVFLAVAVVVYLVADPFGGTPKNVISVALETPYVGQGVAAGTPLIIHGVKVGEVTTLASAPGGGVRLNADLQSGSTTGLTDAMGIDFRPANYFGVTGINLIPADGGRPLRNGTDISLTPKGNFALQALLYRLGELSNQVITQRLINVVERATRYTDALNPLLETMIIVSTTATNVQTVSTAQLLRNATGTSVALPGFIDAMVDTGDHYLKTKIGVKGSFNAEEDLKSNPYVSTYDEAQRAYYDSARKMFESDPDKVTYGRYKEWLVGAETDLFSKVGKLLSSHVYELFPVVEEIRVMSDVVPRLVSPVDIGDTLRELRTRLEHMYAGSGDQRALQVRVILDALPGQAGPLQLALGAAG